MTSPSNKKSDLLTLCGKVRDGDIEPAELARLEAWLLEDPEALDTYRHFMAVCSGLEQTAVLGWTLLDRRESVEEVYAAANTVQLPSEPQSKLGQPQNQIRSRKISVALAAIATVAAAILFAFIGLRNNVSESGNFASVGSVHQPVWGGDRELQPDEPAEAGEYFLASGAAKLKYTNGAEFLVQAPARFSLHNEKRVTLNSGVVSLYIPPDATGFRIDTPFGSVIDHGTRIGVAADSESGLELHVFEGKAELVAPGASIGKMLRANEAATIANETQTVTSVKADQSYFARSLDGLGNLPTVSGGVELRISPPRSVRRMQAELFDVRRASVFAERRNVTVEKDLPVTLAAPGKAASVAASAATLGEGERVDSFLVHFVLPRDHWRDDEVMTASGEITFPRPIVALVSDHPAKTSRYFGHPSTDYPGDKLTGLEDAIDGDVSQADRIEISDDQRTLTFHFQIHGRGHAEQLDRVDQLRVLVQSQGN